MYMKNIYHIIDFTPGLEKEEMLVGYEELAIKLVQSGRLRIDAGEKINFSRLYIPDLNISMMFSYREIHDKTLIKKTTEIIISELKHRNVKDIETKLQECFKIITNEINKYPQPSTEEELKLARLVVQTSHPIVITLALLDNAEIYVSHSYNIGDTLDIISWSTAGKNSGMQSTNGKDVGIFISCGGDPLKFSKENTPFYGDGWAAVARLLVIGGQELGHYSDIMRDKNGKQISRYSANFNATQAKENVRLGRLDDINHTQRMYDVLKTIGLNSLMESEKSLRFYEKNNKFSLVFFKTWVKNKFKTLIFFYKVSKLNYKVLVKFKSENNPALMIQAMIEDNLFNLAPKADVYQNDNKQIEEAIACVEALARVPQQVNKWGYDITRNVMPNLYKVYYNIVIPGCIRAYTNITGLTFTFNSNPIKQSFYIKLSRYLNLNHNLLKSLNDNICDSVRIISF